MPAAPVPFVMRDDLAARAVYSEGAGIGRILPRCVVLPESVQAVASAVHWARARGLPVIARGSGSGMAGGALGDGVILDVSRMRSLASVDAAARRAWVEPGVTRGMLDHAARRRGLWFPLDPSSGAFCSIGGMAATNAAGPSTLKHGAMRQWTWALQCVFGDGRSSLVRRAAPLEQSIPALQRFAAAAPALRRRAAELPLPATRKDASSYGWRAFAASGDLVDLLVGSEGTLAIFAGVEVGLAVVPNEMSTILAAFPSLDAAAAGAARARDAGATACELLDRTFLDVASEARALPLARDTEAVLLIALDGDSAGEVAAAVDSLGKSLQRCGAPTVIPAGDSESAAELWSLRYAASPIISRLPPTLRSMQFIEDCAVAPERLAEFVRGVRAALEQQETRGVIFGHAGDGHVHVNPLIDLTRPRWRNTVHALLENVVELTVSLGGTLSGEHGDGRLRTPLLQRIRDPRELQLNRDLKTIFDPEGLLNPGVKIPLPDQQPIEAIKYDPALPLLPPQARRALDRVAEERAYDRTRLDLLEENA